MGMAIEGGFPSGAVDQQVLDGGKEGQISQGKFLACYEFGDGELSLEDIKELVQLIGQCRALRLVRGLVEEGGTEEILRYYVEDGCQVGLVDREPLLHTGALLKVRRIEGLVLGLLGEVASDCTRLKQTEVTVPDDRDLPEGLMLGHVFCSFVLASSIVYRMELPSQAALFERCYHCARASRTGRAKNFDGSHAGVVID